MRTMLQHTPMSNALNHLVSGAGSPPWWPRSRMGGCGMLAIWCRCVPMSRIAGESRDKQIDARMGIGRSPGQGPFEVNRADAGLLSQKNRLNRPRRGTGCPNGDGP